MVPPAPSPLPFRHPPPLTTFPLWYPTFFVLHLLLFHPSLLHHYLFLFPPHSLSYYRARTRVQEQHASIPFHMDVDRSSMCASALEGDGGDGVTDGGSEDESTETKERRERHTRTEP